METYRGYWLRYNPRTHRWSAWSGAWCAAGGGLLGLYETREDAVRAIDILTRAR